MSNTEALINIAEQMDRFVARVKDANNREDSAQALEALHALSDDARDIERAFHALSPPERAKLQDTSKNAVAALELYISDMNHRLEQTSKALQTFNDSEDAADAYASTQHAS